jgi:hypothetical protein
LSVELTNPTEPFWLQSYNTPATDDPVRTLEQHAKVAATYALDAPGCEEAAIALVGYAISQIEFLRQFNMRSRDGARLSPKNLVELRLECAADTLELKRIGDAVNAKAPRSKLSAEIAWGVAHSMSMLRAIDHVLEEASR